MSWMLTHNFFVFYLYIEHRMQGLNLIILMIVVMYMMMGQRHLQGHFGICNAECRATTGHKHMWGLV
jgi:hypothetical protein